jgi:hypothetical protein
MLGQIIAQREAAGLPTDVVPEKVTRMLLCRRIADRSITESPRGERTALGRSRTGSVARARVQRRLTSV